MEKGFHSELFFFSFVQGDGGMRVAAVTIEEQNACMHFGWAVK